jgi:ABC-type transport system involved in multi-copper enzyme maturation permease subunit
MIRILTIARNDFRHALQDRLVWGAALLLGVMFLPSVGAGSPALWEHLLTMMGDLITFSLVVVAAVGYNSITGERAEGIIRLVLGLSGTRRDVVLGKFLSRLSIVGLALGLVLGIACVQTVRMYGIRSLVPFWVMGGWILVYGVVWTAITIGYSAAFSSQYRTLGALVATYALFTPALAFWGTFVHPLFYFVFTGSFSLPNFKSLADAPSWFHLMLRLNPMQGFAGMVQWSLSMVTGRTPVVGFGFNLLGISVFIAVGVLILFVGLRRFECVDLNDEKSGPSGSTRLLPMVRATTVGGSVVLPFVSMNDQSRVETIVRGDLNRALKNWVVQGVVVLFVLVIVPVIWHTVDLSAKGRFIGTLSSRIVYTFFLPVLVLGTATGYQSVVDERESNTIRYVLGLPGTRRDLVVGKLVARVGIVTGAIVAVLFLTEAIVLFRLGRPHLISFLVGSGWVLLVGVVWTTFVVGVSAGVSSRYRALAVILGVYLLFSTDNGLWGSIVRPLMSLVFTGQFTTPEWPSSANRVGPVWFRYLDGLNPFVALRRILEALRTVTGSLSSNLTVPLVLYSVVITVVFGAGTLYMGYRRFNRADFR